MNIIGRRKLFLPISGAFVIIGIIAMVAFGFELGVDFTSGSLWQVQIPGTSENEVKDFFENELGATDFIVSQDPSTEAYSIRQKEISESTRQEYLRGLIDRFGGDIEDLDFWTISPSVSKELARKAIIAIVLVLVGISFYVAFAFRKASGPINPWKYGIITLITLAHDMIIPLGIFAVLGKYAGASIDTNIVVALLVVMGFSVHDTIVVFDRIRENVLNSKANETLENIVNRSVNETIVRSVNTSLTLIVVLVALLLMGPGGLNFFVFIILAGTIAGTYSSIFLASPLLVATQNVMRRAG